MTSKVSSSNSPFFSIIIPVYKAEEFLSECIESILMQTFDDYELILVNDCSPDGSISICRHFEQEHSCIKVIDLDKNSGVVNAREVGLVNALGNYIIYVDADDSYLSPNRLKLIHDEIATHESDIVATGYSVGSLHENVHEVRNSLKVGYYSPNVYGSLRERIFSFSRFGCDRLLFPNVWSKAVKKELYMLSLGKVSHSLKMGEDAAICYVALALADSLSVLDDTSYFYRQHSSQVSQGYFKNYFPGCLENYMNMEKVIAAYNPSGDYHRAIIENELHVIAYSVLNEARNNDRAAAYVNLQDIINNEAVRNIVIDMRFTANPFEKMVIAAIQRKSLSMMKFLGKIYCLFVH